MTSDVAQVKINDVTTEAVSGVLSIAQKLILLLAQNLFSLLSYFFLTHQVIQLSYLLTSDDYQAYAILLTRWVFPNRTHTSWLTTELAMVFTNCGIHYTHSLGSE